MKLVVESAVIAALVVGCGAKSSGGDGSTAPNNENATGNNSAPVEKANQAPSVATASNGFSIEGSATTTSWTLTGGTIGPNKAVTKLAMNDADYRLDIITGKRIDSVFFTNATIEGSCAKDPSNKIDPQLITGACSRVNLSGTQASADITGFTYRKTGTSIVAGYNCDIFALNLTTNVTYEGRTYAGTMTGNFCIAKKIPVKIGLVDFTKSVNGLEITVSSPAVRQKIEASAADLSGMIMRSTSSAEANGTGIIGAKVATNSTTYTVTKVTSTPMDTAIFSFPMAGYSMAN